jgi:hypothetical protein
MSWEGHGHLFNLQAVLTHTQPKRKTSALKQWEGTISMPSDPRLNRDVQDNNAYGHPGLKNV